jgi:hypothetical protein
MMLLDYSIKNKTGTGITFIAKKINNSKTINIEK